MKIIYIYYYLFSKRDYTRFGLEYFNKKNIETDVINLYPYYYGNDLASKLETFEQYKFSGYYEAQTLLDMVNLIYTLAVSDKDLFFLILPIDDERTSLVIKTLKSHFPHVKVMAYATNGLPTDYEYAWNSVAAIKKNIITTVLRLKRRIFGFRNAKIDILINGSIKSSIPYYSFVSQDTKVIPAHTMDIENIISGTSDVVLEDCDYIVYIDASIADSSEYVATDIVIDIDMDSYYKKLFAFLRLVEIEYKKNVIIAAHPTSRFFLDCAGTVNGFKYYKYKTKDLVRDCDFCLCEASTAISFPVFYDKPLILFKMKEISFYFMYINYFEIALNKQSISIDNNQEMVKKQIEEELKNKKGYMKYKLNYLSQEASAPKSVWEKIIDISLEM